MRLPNGYGSVYKLSGKRRRPWVAAITTGRDIQAHKQTRKVLGYFGTRQEALNALAEYNKDPYDIITTKYTFSEIYENGGTSGLPENLTMHSRPTGWHIIAALFSIICRSQILNLTICKEYWTVSKSSE